MQGYCTCLQGAISIVNWYSSFSLLKVQDVVDYELIWDVSASIDYLFEWTMNLSLRFRIFWQNSNYQKIWILHYEMDVSFAVENSCHLVSTQHQGLVSKTWIWSMIGLSFRSQSRNWLIQVTWHSSLANHRPGIWIIILSLSSS